MSMSQIWSRRWRRLVLTVVAAASVVTLGISAAPASGSVPPLTAQLFAKVAGPTPGAFGTSLEGASFDATGRFYFVDTTAPPGQPKILTLDMSTRTAHPVYTDLSSQLNCLVFAPDHTMYVCDLKGKRVARYDPAQHTLSTVLSTVGRIPVVPNDLAIDGAGNMYVADYQGTPTVPTGRVILRDPTGKATVVVSGLAHPNGITLTPDQHALWITEDLSGKLDHLAEQVSSPADTTTAPTIHTASYLSLGAQGYADSVTTDGAGNVYLAVYGSHKILVFDPNGLQIGAVTLPATVPSTTHVAIQPGTRRAFVTASGPDGGYIYTFTALAPAAPGVPNGG